MYVQDFMPTTVTTVTPDTLVRTAYQVMRDTQIRHLPVVTNEGTLVGIITDRDIRRAAASDVPHLAEHELLSLLKLVYDGGFVGDVLLRCQRAAAAHLVV